MKNSKSLKLLTGLVSILLFSVTAAFAATDVPLTLSYQCNIAKAANNTGLTEVDLQFFLCADPNCSSITLSTFEKDDVRVVNGIVSVTLEDSDLKNGGAGSYTIAEACKSATHLGLKINNGSLLQPVSELSSSIFAVRAAVADKLSGNYDINTILAGNLPAGTIDGAAIAPNSISGTIIKDGTIQLDDLANNILDTSKITTKFTKDVSLNRELGSNDQGIVFVEGQTLITLPDPTKSAGQKFTIKKTDYSIQRPCIDGPTCSILPQTNFVTIKAGLGAAEANKVTPIEGRTNAIHLYYKNSYVTVISDGKLWHIIGSNPPQDIYPPAPGNYGKVEIVNNVKIAAGANVTLSWKRASDCDLRSCDICSDCPNCADQQELDYMVYYSQGAAKLTTMAAIDEIGIECLPNWITAESGDEMITASCYPADPSGANFNGDFKLNVVVRDRYGNKGLYCSPGDNTPPEIGTSVFYSSPNHGNGIIAFRWTLADDTYGGTITGDTIEQLRYAIYYVVAGDNEKAEDSCLQQLNITGLPTCAFKVHPTAAAVPSSSEEPTAVRLSSTNSSEGEVEIHNLTAGTYFFTIIVVDRAGNTNQYQVQKILLGD
jgi:hypothetical protein